MKIVICPDSFKESLPADAAAQAIAEGVRELWPDAECVCLPLADGGEGTLDALVSATGGQLLRHTVRGPLGAPVDARFAVLGDGETALIEMAEAAGLMRIPRSERDPLRASTYGVGELIAAALAQGARRILLGLGGSATQDGGAGMLQALGARLLDAHGQPLPVGQQRFIIQQHRRQAADGVPAVLAAAQPHFVGAGLEVGDGLQFAEEPGRDGELGSKAHAQ